MSTVLIWFVVIVGIVGILLFDSMMILDKRPDSTKCDTQNEGLIRCMRSINRLAVQVKNHKIDEADIQEYMITGRTALPDEYKELMDQEIYEFVNRLKF